MDSAAAIGGGSIAAGSPHSPLARFVGAGGLSASSAAEAAVVSSALSPALLARSKRRAPVTPKGSSSSTRNGFARLNGHSDLDEHDEHDSELAQHFSNGAVSDEDEPGVEDRSVFGCICQGLLLSRVFCTRCEQVSDTVDPFEDLPAPIPQDERLRAIYVQSRREQQRLARAAGEVVDDDADDENDDEDSGDHGRGRKRTGAGDSDSEEEPESGWLGWLSSFLVGGPPEKPLKLMDCLFAFFGEEKLEGDNQYRCGNVSFF